MTPGDAVRLREIARESFSRLWEPAEFGHFLAHERGHNFGLEIQGTLQAYFLGLLTAGELDVVTIATASGYRRRGLAARLVRYALGRPQVDGAVLEVEEGNAAARALYAKLGFEIVGRRPKYYEGRRDAILMRWGRAPN